MEKFKSKSCFFILLFVVVEFFFSKNLAFAQNVKEFTLHKGQSLFISSKHLRNEEILVSEDKNIASVSNGIITANSVGETFCKSKSVELDGTAVEKIYKIKVLPPQLLKYTFSEPNNPKCGEMLTLSAITDASVAQVKFLINTKDGKLEKNTEEKFSDGKNFVHKVHVKLNDFGDFAVSVQVKTGGFWQNAGGSFTLKVCENSKMETTKRRASDKCVNYIMAKEGFKSALKVDCCARDTYDIGYGNVVKPGEEFFNNITRTEAKSLLLKRLNDDRYLRSLNNFIVKNNLYFSQNQFDALLSFTYNVGMSWLVDSDLQKIILDAKNTNSKNDKNAVRSIGTVVSDDGLRLREQPNTKSKILGVLKFNEQVEILNEASDGWYKVKTKNGQEGFCFAEFLLAKKEYTDSNIMTVNSENGLRLRSQPNTNSNVIDVLSFDEQIEVLDKDYNKWYKVKTKSGKEGFCFAEFLTIKPVNVENLIDKKAFSKEFLTYHNAGGRFVKGLLNRRIEELQMLFYNDYSTDGAKNKYNFSLPSCS